MFCNDSDGNVGKMSNSIRIGKKSCGQVNDQYANPEDPSKKVLVNKRPEVKGRMISASDDLLSHDINHRHSNYALSKSNSLELDW